MRVLTYNVFTGFLDGPFDKRHVPLKRRFPHQIQALLALDFDVACLQEVYDRRMIAWLRNHLRHTHQVYDFPHRTYRQSILWAVWLCLLTYFGSLMYGASPLCTFVGLIERLLLLMCSATAVSALVMDWCPAIPFATGNSTGLVTIVNKRRVSCVERDACGTLPTGEWIDWFNPRGYLTVVVADQSSSPEGIRVTNVHLDVSEWGCAKQVDHLSVALLVHPPAILAGDFNRPKDSSTMDQVCCDHGLVHADPANTIITWSKDNALTKTTFLPSAPDTQIDHVLVNAKYFEATKGGCQRIIDSQSPPLSDHYGVCADIDLLHARCLDQ